MHRNNLLVILTLQALQLLQHLKLLVHKGQLENKVLKVLKDYKVTQELKDHKV